MKSLYLFFNSLCGKKDWYCIACILNDKESFKHEWAHALYMRVPEYYKAQKKNLKENKKWLVEIRKKLKKEGYADGVVSDEIQAYLSTDPPDSGLRPGGMSQWRFNKLRKQFRGVFKKYHYSFL